MPDVLGMNYHDARKQIVRELKDEGFQTVNVEYEWVSTTDPDKNLTVLKSDPTANTHIPVNSSSVKITLFVAKIGELPSPTPTKVPTKAPTKAPSAAPTRSSAPTSVPTKKPTKAPTATPAVPRTVMPDIVGMNYHDAKSLVVRELKNAGFETVNVEFVWIETKDPERNLKAQSSDPAANSTVYLLDLSITVKIYVAKLPTESTPVPTKAPTKAVTKTPTKAPTNKPTAKPTATPTSKPSFKQFVERLYECALNRTADAAGLDYWCKEVQSGRRSGADCARYFLLEAPEFMNRNLAPDAFVETLYKTFFNRNSDAAGKKGWVDALYSNKMSRAQVVENFIESTEWCNVCATYGVKSGALYHKATVASENAKEFATRLYTCCLGRSAEAGGLKYWSLALTNFEATGCDAAREFFTSDEFVGLKTSNEEYVRRLYKTFMGRTPDSSEVAFWAGKIKEGKMTRREVLASFGSSTEFTQICAKYGISRGSI